MQKTSNLSVRIDPVLKESSERILNQLGIPMSSAITLFLKQVVINNGIPFDVKLPKGIVNIDDLSDEEIQKEIQKGIDDFDNGRYVSLEEFEKYFKVKYNL